METKLIKFAQISTVIYSKTMFANVLKHYFISKMRQYISILDYYVVLGPLVRSCDSGATVAKPGTKQSD